MFYIDKIIDIFPVYVHIILLFYTYSSNVGSRWLEGEFEGRKSVVARRVRRRQVDGRKASSKVGGRRSVNLLGVNQLFFSADTVLNFIISPAYVAEHSRWRLQLIKSWNDMNTSPFFRRLAVSGRQVGGRSFGGRLVGGRWSAIGGWRADMGNRSFKTMYTGRWWGFSVFSPHLIYHPFVIIQ